MTIATTHDELGRQKQDRRDQEDVRRVIRLVRRMLDQKDLGDRRARRENDERRPDAVLCCSLWSRPAKGNVARPAAAATATR